ncbi:MAG: ATP-binding cassette domain-containing protein [Mariprofundales bacterium]
MKNYIHIVANFDCFQLQAKTVFDDGIIIISGENGSGKTTLLRCLAGLERTQGQILFNGKTWLDSNVDFILPVEARRIGCVWNDVALLPWLSVENNIALGADIVNKHWLNELAEQLKITPFMQRKPSALSTGQAQRVALARAIYNKPSALLLDEPFSAQAPVIRQHLRLMLKSMQNDLNIAVIMVSHDIEDAEVLAYQHWRMREGRLLKEITRTEVNKVKQA